MKLIQIPATVIDLIWDKILPCLDKVIAQAPDDITRDGAKGRLKDGSNLLIAVVEGESIIAINIINVEVLDTGKKILFISATGGERLEEWMEEFLKMADEIAKSLGCFEVRGSASRKGWLRVIKSYGWEDHYAIIKHKVGA